VVAPKTGKVVEIQRGGFAAPSAANVTVVMKRARRSKKPELGASFGGRPQRLPARSTANTRNCRSLFGSTGAHIGGVCGRDLVSNRSPFARPQNQQRPIRFKSYFEQPTHGF
jgi:hypothetical protein